MKVLLTSLNRKHAFNPIVNRLFEPLAGEFEFTRDPIGELGAVFLSFIEAEAQFDLDDYALDRITRRDCPIVVFDHSESFGKNFAIGFSELHTSSYYWPVHEFLMANKHRVAAYFKRELRTDVPLQLPVPIYPIDWTIPPMHDFDSIATRKQFDSRPIDVFMSWGYSSESRPRMFGELMKVAGRFGAHFCLSVDDLTQALKDKKERIFALLFSPWFRRINIKELMEWQAQSKVSLSLKGSGYKCFRSAEASYNCVMAHQSPDLMQWAYPWGGGTNCIGLPNMEDGEIDTEGAVNQLWDWLRVHQGSLYPIYTSGIINNRNYHMEAYSRDYLLPKLEEVLA